MLRAEKLSVGYDKKILIDGIDLELKAGKIVTLIGPNGSGKSTVLKTITKQLKKLGGSVCVAGREIEKISEGETAKHISMVMTERIRPELMTCREVIATGRFPYTGRLGILSEDDWKIVDEAIRTVHAEDVAEKDFNKISDGQRQRVMLARAICQDTEIIVLDEPTSFLDMFYKLDLLKIIKKLAEEQNKAIIMSLHELELVKAVSDTVVCLDGKKVVKAGTADEIFRDDFIQKLYGVKKEEFNPENGTINFKTEQSARDWNGRDSGCGTEWSNEGAEDAGTMESPTRNEEKGCAHKNTKVIMIQGTMSNAGKSLVVAGLCRIFKQDGYKVAPFKSQNMALNSFITKNGLEMGRAQVMQAEAAGIEPCVEMNPILLKPTNDKGSQVIVNGEVLGNMSAREYFGFKKKLVPDILKAFKKLADSADIIVIEGAGSPAEINLRENDIVNMGMAELVDAPVLLVGDIDRGGVFAQLFGTVALLSENEKKRVKGLVINKFRGDKSLLDSGIEMLEEKCGIPVTGVLPYLKISVEDEDSLSERFDGGHLKEEALVRIGVVKLPRISNFTDFNVFEMIDGVGVEYITEPEKIEKMDMVIIPGTKNTISDLKWLRESGMEAAVKKFSGHGIVFGICGGFQMLGNSVSDPDGVEEGGQIRGMELLDAETVLLKEKFREQVAFEIGKNQKVLGELSCLNGKKVSGYEIHMGRTEIGQKAYEFASGAFCGNVYGSYIHGFFDEGDVAFCIAQVLAEKKGISLKDKKFDFKAFKESQYDLLADEMRKNLNLKAIYDILG